MEDPVMPQPDEQPAEEDVEMNVDQEVNADQLDQDEQNHDEEIQ